MFMMQHALDLKDTAYDYLYYHVVVERGLLKNDADTQLVFLGTMYAHPSIVVPKGSILMDFDHTHWIHDRWKPSLLDGNRVVTFSRLLNEKLRKMSPMTDFRLFKFGYASQHDYGYSYLMEYEYDICFLGTIYERRKKILDMFRNKYKCFFHNHIYVCEASSTHKVGNVLRGRERANIYKRSKVVLSIAFNDDYLECSNASRIYPAVSSGAFVVSERCRDESQNRELDKICVNVPLEEMFKQVERYVRNDEERERLRYQHHSNVKKMISDIP